MSAPPARPRLRRLRGGQLPEPSERDHQQAVMTFARVNQWTVKHFHDSRRQVRRNSGETLWIGDHAAQGVPDLLLVRERVVWAELKARRGRLSPAQGIFIGQLRAAGAEVYVWDPDAWDEIKRVLGRALSAA